MKSEQVISTEGTNLFNARLAQQTDGVNIKKLKLDFCFTMPSAGKPELLIKKLRFFLLVGQGYQIHNIGIPLLPGPGLLLYYGRAGLIDLRLWLFYPAVLVLQDRRLGLSDPQNQDPVLHCQGYYWWRPGLSDSRPVLPDPVIRLSLLESQGYKIHKFSFPSAARPRIS